MNNIKHIYIAAAIIALALVGGLFLHAYISNAKDVAQAEQVKADVQKQISDLRSDLKDTLEAIRKDREQAKTPQQIVQRLPQYVPLPQPIYMQPASTVTSSGPTSLPDAPVPQGSLVIPAESVKAFWEHETQCKEDGLKLAECQKELPLVTQRAEAAEKVMKGGGFWAGVKRNAKWFVIGGAAGAGAALATRR